ncbi:hypothetical protein CJP73_00560 [Neopusillimonas maritima]|uniref:Uncharacterized protein n=1 Tax=Neopusillimonas maritima TaxID=2026239 RepID=A0A3A1YUT7_9BURK|nr:hypothetical protein CJP73_00560 [Neopusillimonas maritima]
MIMRRNIYFLNNSYRGKRQKLRQATFSQLASRGGCPILLSDLRHAFKEPFLVNSSDGVVITEAARGGRIDQLNFVDTWREKPGSQVCCTMESRDVTGKQKTAIQSTWKMRRNLKANTLHDQFSGQHPSIHTFRRMGHDVLAEISWRNNCPHFKKHGCDISKFCGRSVICRHKENPPVVDDVVVGTSDSTTRGDTGVSHG